MSTYESTSRWQRKGEQARSRLTQDAILDAAELLFGRHGIDATSVTDVAAQAGRSIGSLYHHFDNKEMLVAAVVDRIIVDLEAALEPGIDRHRWQGESITGVVTRFVSSSLAHSRHRPGYKRIVLEASLTDAETRSRYRRFREQFKAGLVEFILVNRDRIGHPDPELAVGFVVDQISAMLAARLDADFTPNRLEAESDERFLAEVLASVTGYLRLPDGA